MQSVQYFCSFLHEDQCLFFGKLAFVIEIDLNRRCFDVFLNDVAFSVDFVRENAFIKLGDAGDIEACERLGFAFEQFEAFEAVVLVELERLDCELVARVQVCREISFAVRAFAQKPLVAVFEHEQLRRLKCVACHSVALSCGLVKRCIWGVEIRQLISIIIGNSRLS